jgi:multicomponent Na+:H+ antiporter subunit F
LTDLAGALAFFLLLSLTLGLWRVWLGPSPADRMMSAQLFGTTGIAILLLLSEQTGRPALRDVALILALLSILAVAAFTTRGWTRRRGGEVDDDAR